MEKIFVVIPNWNGADLIAESLTSLEKQSLSAKIVVVDNGSDDSSVEIIEQKFPNVHLIKLPVNTGFDGGVNRGIEYAMQHGAEAVALYNNDAVAHKDWLKHLATKLASDDKIGIVHAKQLRSDGQYIDSTGDEYSIWGIPFPRGRNHKDTGQYDQAEEVFSAPAGATLYRTKLFEAIGIFDEDFFAYYEDVDISFRARLVGWKIWYEPKAEVYHHVAATSSKHRGFARYHVIKNFYALYLKNMPMPLVLLYFPLFVATGCLLFASSVQKGLIGPHLRGAFSAIKLLPKTLAKRRHIQKQRVVSSTEINRFLYKKLPPRIPPLEH